MKKGTAEWLELANRDLEAASILVQNEYVYIDSRYPSGLGVLPSGFPTKKDADELLKIAQTVYKEIIRRITHK